MGTVTLCITTCVKDGIVMSSESREILATDSWMKNIKSPDFEILSDNHPKVHLLAGKYGLCYSGTSRVCSWNWEATLADLNQLAESHSIYTIAAQLDTILKEVLPKHHEYSFYLGGYVNGNPVVIKGLREKLIYPQDPSGLGYDSITQRIRTGCFIVGVVDILVKLLNGEEISWNDMSLLDAVEFNTLNILVGTKYLRYFKQYQEVSRGPIRSLILTPTKVGFIDYDEVLLNAINSRSTTH